MKIGQAFLKITEVKEGDIMEILNEGAWVESKQFKYPDGNPKQDCQFQIRLPLGERTFTMSKTNREACKEAWGDETLNWIGKTARIGITPLPQLKKNMITLFPIDNSVTRFLSPSNTTGDSIGAKATTPTSDPFRKAA